MHIYTDVGNTMCVPALWPADIYFKNGQMRVDTILGNDMCYSLLEGTETVLLEL